MKYYFAPVQGHTDAAYRHYHAKNYGGDLIYLSPFVRLEKDRLRPKDIKDLTSELNNNHILIPQIIFRDRYELEKLIELVSGLGFKKINLNMGCPFPLQTGHGRGAATVGNQNLINEIVEVIKSNPDIQFSIKMRLGMSQPDEWHTLIDNLNKVNIEFIAVHPRIARQQYSGDLHLNEYRDILKISRNPVIYNGDLKKPVDISEILSVYPETKGIMIGRGALARPSLFYEISENEIEQKERILKMKEFHRQLLRHYEEVLCGEAQIMSKISPFWEYSEEEIGKKPWKSLKKAKTLPKYKTALTQF